MSFPEYTTCTLFIFGIAGRTGKVTNQCVLGVTLGRPGHSPRASAIKGTIMQVKLDEMKKREALDAEIIQILSRKIYHLKQDMDVITREYLNGAGDLYLKSLMDQMRMKYGLESEPAP
jgi:hypothetical protein